MNSIYKSKNQDYGDSFAKTFDEYVPVMCAIRLEDKLQRFKRLIKADAQVKDESIRDTLIDLANYSILTIMELDEKINLKKGV
jgi:hypothetical protein